MDCCILSTDAKMAILWNLNSRNHLVSYKEAGSAMRGTALVRGSRDDGREHVDGFISCQPARSFVHMFAVLKEQPLFKCGVPEAMHCIAVSNDGAFAVCGGASGRAYLWDLSSGALLRAWNAHYKRIGAAAFSPCGTVIVTGGDDGVVQVWAVASLVDIVDQSDLSTHPTVYASWADHLLPITSLRFGPGLGLSSLLISTSLDRTARVWDVASGRCVVALACPGAAHVSCVDPMGRRLYLACDAAAGSASVCEFDLPAAAARSADPSALLLLAGGGPVTAAGPPSSAAAAGLVAGAVNDLAISQDGGTLITAGQDGSVRLWDTASRCCVQVFEGHGSAPVVSLQVVQRFEGGAGGKPDASSFMTPMAPLRKHQVPLPVEWKGSTTGPIDAVVVVARSAAAPAVEGTASDAIFAEDLSALLAALDASRVGGAAADAPAGASVERDEVIELRRRNAQLEDENRRWKAVSNALLQKREGASSASEGAVQQGSEAVEPPTSAAGAKRGRE